MSLPFTAQEFFEVFRRYNEAVWPLQILFNALALGALVFRRYSGRWISAILALLWTWIAVVYQLGFFMPVNAAAVAFAVLFFSGAALFWWQGVVHDRLRFDGNDPARCATGYALALYGLLVYPIVAYLAGRELPETASFGLPCPTTIFTFAMLAFLKAPHPRSVFIAPILWTLVAAQAAWLLGVYEDFGLLFAGVAGVWFALYPDQRRFA